MTAGVYAIHFRIFGLVCTYWGQSSDIGKRWQQHLDMLVAGSHHSRSVQSVYNMGAKPEFVVWRPDIESVEERLKIEAGAIEIDQYSLNAAGGNMYVRQYMNGYSLKMSWRQRLVNGLTGRGWSKWKYYQAKPF